MEREGESATSCALKLLNCSELGAARKKITEKSVIYMCIYIHTHTHTHTYII
jgi:hypothetical protein